jgi:hypothetical protein
MPENEKKDKLFLLPFPHLQTEYVTASRKGLIS